MFPFYPVFLGLGLSTNYLYIERNQETFQPDCYITVTVNPFEGTKSHFSASKRLDRLRCK